MNVDVKGKRLFMAALGNQTVEVLDLTAGKRPQSSRVWKTPRVILCATDELALCGRRGPGFERL